MQIGHNYDLRKCPRHSFARIMRKQWNCKLETTLYRQYHAYLHLSVSPLMDALNNHQLRQVRLEQVGQRQLKWQSIYRYVSYFLVAKGGFKSTCSSLQSLFNSIFGGGTTAPSKTESTRLKVPKSTYWGRLPRPSQIQHL